MQAEHATTRPGEPDGPAAAAGESTGRAGDRRARRAGDRRGRPRGRWPGGGEIGDAPGAAGDRADGERADGGLTRGTHEAVGGPAAPGDGRPAGPAVPRWRSRIGVGIGLVALALLGYYLVTLVQVWSTGRSDQARPVDAIVVLGAAQYDGRPSPQLAARLDHAVELWPDGLAPIVIVTGGNRPGDRFTEAESSAQYLLDRGVPAASIVMEDRGSTTYESLELVGELLAQRGDRVLIVTDPYHALRSRLIAQELGLTAYVSPTDTSVVTGSESFRRHAQEAAGVAIGRVIGFDRLSRLT